MWTALPPELAAQLEPILSQAPGKVALACHHFTTGERWAVGDAVMPAASLIKVPLAIAAYQAVEHQALPLTGRTPVPALADDDEAEFDNLGLAPSGTAFTWQKVIDRMLTESDNAATNVLIDRLGLGAIEGLTRSLGLERTALRRKMLDAQARAAGRENTTTATEMVALLEALHRGRLLSPEHTAELLGVLAQVRDDEKLAMGLPDGLSFAHKTGELPGWRHDAGIVLGTHSWAVCMMAEGEPPLTDMLMARVMTLLVGYFAAKRGRFAELGEGLAAERERLLADPRLGWDTLELGWEAGRMVISGMTTFPERLSALPADVTSRARHLAGRPGVVVVPCLQLRRGPGHAHELVSQLRLGDPLTLLEEGPDWTLLRSPDGYLAYGKSNNLRPAEDWQPTHRVVTPLVSAETVDGRVLQLSAGSRLRADGEGAWRLPDGGGLLLEPEHLQPLDRLNGPESALQFARRLLGLPYLWGGATGWGIDCSGLAQLACFVGGALLPRDADQQQAATVAVEAIADLEPGDLVFFPGHVGLYLGEMAFIHASAQYGCVTINSFDPASERFNTWLFENFTGGGRSPLRAGTAIEEGPVGGLR